MLLDDLNLYFTFKNGELQLKARRAGIQRLVALVILIALLGHQPKYEYELKMLYYVLHKTSIDLRPNYMMSYQQIFD